MANGNDDSISARIVLSQVDRVRERVENGNYAACPVAGEKDVQLFIIDAMTAILKQSQKVNFMATLSGGTIGAAIVGIIVGAWKMWNVIEGH